MGLEELRKVLRNWNVGRLDAESAAEIRAMTREDLDELLEALEPAARTCPIEGRLSTMPNFMPIGNIYNRTGCEEFQPLGYLLGLSGTLEGLRVLRRYFESDPSREVRLAAGHFLLMYPGTGAEVAAAADARANELVGWFRLWVGAQIAISRVNAYVPIAARVAASSERTPLLHAVMNAGWRHYIDDPRWAELARQMLAIERDNDWAMSVIANTKDTSSVTFLVERAAHPNRNTAAEALSKLAQMLDGDELWAALEPAYEVSTQKPLFESIWEQKKLARGLAILDARTQERDAEIGTMSFPFPFFGAGDPDEVYGFGTMYYAVCFAGTVDPAAKLQIANTIREDLMSPGLSKLAWDWLEKDGDAWAYFGTGNEPFDTQALLRSIHDDVPIRVATLSVFLEGKEDDWTAWSRRQTAWPEIPDFPKKSKDSAFEKARKLDDDDDDDDDDEN